MPRQLARVDVQVAENHGFSDGANIYFLSVPQPRMNIVQVWNSSHPDPDRSERLRSESIHPGQLDVFAAIGKWQGRWACLAKLCGKESAPCQLVTLAELTGVGGQIVVRVEPHGESLRASTRERPVRNQPASQWV